MTREQCEAKCSDDPLCSGFNFGNDECQFYKVPTGNKWDPKKFCASGKFQYYNGDNEVQNFGAGGNLQYAAVLTYVEKSSENGVKNEPWTPPCALGVGRHRTQTVWVSSRRATCPAA